MLSMLSTPPMLPSLQDFSLPASSLEPKKMLVSPISREKIFLFCSFSSSYYFSSLQSFTTKPGFSKEWTVLVTTTHFLALSSQTSAPGNRSLQVTSNLPNVNSCWLFDSMSLKLFLPWNSAGSLGFPRPLLLILLYYFLMSYAPRFSLLPSSLYDLSKSNVFNGPVVKFRILIYRCSLAEKTVVCSHFDSFYHFRTQKFSTDLCFNFSPWIGIIFEI